jgi:ribose/xylose/arabinose/galactoside ABC-type transport system permease subunit
MAQAATVNREDDRQADGSSAARQRRIADRMRAALRAIESWRVIVAFGVVFLAATAFAPNFTTNGNLVGLLQSMTFQGLLAVGVALVLIGGEIDISVGSIYALSSVVTALVLHNGSSVMVAAAAGLAVATGCGLLNGFIADLLGIPAVVVTIATLGLYGGVALVVSKGSPVSDLGIHPTFFDRFGSGTTIAGISYVSVVFVVVIVLMALLLQRTVFGFHVYALGSNPRTARLIGVRVRGLRILLLTISGITGGISGVVSVAYLHSASPTSGSNYALGVLAAVIIGGVSLVGGRGTMLGVFFGLAVVAIIANVLVLRGVSPSWTTAVAGIVLIAAVGIQRIGVRREA